MPCSEHAHIECLAALIQQDPLRLRALQAVRSLNLPTCYIAAGFVRNLVWDHLHDKLPDSATPLNDVDVIYYDANEQDAGACYQYEARLKAEVPDLNWQARNQARMHLRNGDAPYKDVIDAMAHWPEKETAVAVRLTKEDEIECISAFGFASLFALKITPTPKRDIAIFHQRLNDKGWLRHWPKLTVSQIV